MSSPIKELIFNGSTPVTLTFPFISTHGMGSLGFLCFANAGVSFRILWSPDGINTDLIDVTAVGAGNGVHISSQVKAKFMSLDIIVTTNPTIVRLDSFFFLDTIEEEIDVTTLTSAGGTSLVNDGTGPTLATKGLTAGTSITFGISGTDITINAAAAASTVFSDTGPGVITTQTSLTQGKLLGNMATNTLAAGQVVSVILGGEACVISGTGDSNCIIDGEHNVISGGCDRSGIFAGNHNTISSDADENCIIGGEFSTISNIVSKGAIIGGELNLISSGLRGSILGGFTNKITLGADNNVICGGRNNLFSGLGNDSGIFAGELNKIQGNTDRSAILAGCNNVISSTSNNNCILAGEDNIIDSAAKWSMIMGSFLTSSHHGAVLLGDSVSTTRMTSSSVNRMSARFSSGYELFTNTAQTTGMTMYAGLSAWSAVSDRNKKENIVECDYESMLGKLKEIPIYKFNYIGNHKEIVNISPMAQDWCEQFPCLDITYNEETVTPKGDVVLEEKTRPATPRLSIDQGDLIGLLLCSVKALTKRIEALEGK